MNHINRSIAIVHPKQPFLDWTNQLPDARFKVSAKDFKNDRLVILIPEYSTEEEAKHFVSEVYDKIFEEKLWGWCTNEFRWPQARTKELFWQWFEVDFHSEIIDSCEGPIEKERD